MNDRKGPSRRMANTRQKRPVLRCERCNRLRKKTKRFCKHCRDLKDPTRPKRMYHYACRDCGCKVTMDRHITTNKTGLDHCRECGSTFLVPATDLYRATG